MLFKERFFGKGEKESAEFTERKKNCLGMRDGLVKCEKSLSAWIEGASKMSQAASTMAESATEDPDMIKLGTQVAMALGEEKSIKIAKECRESVKLKIKLMDKLKKDTSELEERRIIRNRFKRKMDEAKKPEDREKFHNEYSQALNSYNDLFAEVEGSFEFMVEESRGHGGFGLAKAEMDAFKHSACVVFADCNEACQSISVPSEINLPSEWTKFNDRKDEKVQSVKGARLGVDSSRFSQSREASGGLAPPPPPPPGGEVAATYPPTSPPPPPVPGMAAPPPPVYVSPPSLARPNSSLCQARALYAYDPQNSDELSLKEGDVITVTKKEDDGWWMGSLPNGSQGVFPSNYVEVVNDDDFGGAV